VSSWFGLLPIHLSSSFITKFPSNIRKLQDNIKTWEHTFDNELQKMQHEIEGLKQWFTSKGLVQIEQQGILQAGFKQEPTPREQLDNMISFMEGDNAGGHTPPCIATVSEQPSNLKQAGTKKPVSDFEQMQTLLRFSEIV
jgi:hypothetical protein